MVIFFIGILFITGFIVYLYNKMVFLKIQMQEAWSGVDVQLKRRSDLVPNLVEVVKGYAEHEKGVLEKVTELRSQIDETNDVKKRSDLENNISKALRSIFAVVEAYPDLKADKSFLSLHESLVQIEEEIQLSRRYFNGTVRNLNIFINSFPNNVVAGLFKFSEQSFFEIESAIDRSAPEVILS